MNPHVTIGSGVILVAVGLGLYVAVDGMIMRVLPAVPGILLILLGPVGLHKPYRRPATYAAILVMIVSLWGVARRFFLPGEHSLHVLSTSPSTLLLIGPGAVGIVAVLYLVLTVRWAVCRPAG